MDSRTSLAIIRILKSAHRLDSLHVADLVTALRWMLPGGQLDETTVLEHLTLMVEQGYVMPVAVTAEWL